ncbi:ubiquitin-conjugating enzyme RWD [Paramuricea clavata]|uniref:Ubiquitin-conjugating enzyme RWD n=1 Tax=Paramuricea clavata TaxID=317549 RepID=A0A6S7LSK4_PARCT|nr:ubiquitin-conjugating enzyme RWD [Paramuricea clavata]
MASVDIRVDARQRLIEELKAWKANHPKDFFAKPCKSENGTMDMLNWKCGKVTIK